MHESGLGPRTGWDDVELDTRAVVVVLHVPSSWRFLNVREIAQRLKKQPHLIPNLALEVKRWANKETGLDDLIANLRKEAAPAQEAHDEA